MRLQCHFGRFLGCFGKECERGRESEEYRKEANEALSPLIFKKEWRDKTANGRSNALISKINRESLSLLFFESASKKGHDHGLEITLNDSDERRGKEPNQNEGARKTSCYASR